MVIYSIKDLEKLSGVKAHTLRIWERRYEILKPKRTPTNIRYYMDEDLKHILNVALLNRNGFKISKIAKMGAEEIQKHVAEITDIDESFEGQLDTLTISLLELDEEKFVKLLNKNIEQHGFKEAMLDVIYP
ncbi:MAG: MerR family transcriptional regulator, partial [Bacteroidota bacterium]